MFFIKKSEVIFDTFTSNEQAYKYYSIQKASEFFPSSIKTAPSKYLDYTKFEQSTLKRCVGVLEYYKHGFILPLWTDIEFKFNESVKGVYNWRAASNIELASHNPQQWDFYTEKDKVTHIKITSPWSFKCKEDIRFLWQRPYWNFNPFENHSFPSAIIEYKYQRATELNLFLDVNSDNIFLKANTPMAHIIPLTDKQIVIKNHLVSEEEYKKISNFNRKSTFANAYYDNKKNEIEYEKKQKKCPFGFGS